MREPLRCHECGAALPGETTCLDRFHELLAAEAHNDELRQIHGLTVATYHLQHPSLTKPWYQLWGRASLRRIFGDGEDWLTVFLEGHPRGVGRQRAAAESARRKAAGGTTMPDWVITQPIPGELTVTAIDPHVPAGQTAQVMAWAHSVAKHRYLEKASPTWPERTL